MPDESFGEDTLAYYLRVAQEESFRAFSRRCGDPELRPGRYALLSIVAANPGLTQGELALACRRDKSTLTPALNDLAKRGLLSRARTPDDLRAYRIALTPAGETMLNRLRRHAQRHDAELDAIVGRDKPIVLAALKRLIAALSDSNESS